jgi:hypothetical protein
MPSISRIGPKMALCGGVAAIVLVAWAARYSAAQNLAQDVPPPVGQVPGAILKGEEPKPAVPQAKPETNSEVASPLPAPGPADRLSVPHLTAEPEPSPFDGTIGTKAPAPIPIAPGDATAEVDDPEKVATAFLEQNQKLAESHLKTLKEEAEKLKARLIKVEAGIKRWDSLLEALRQSQSKVTTTPPAATSFRLPTRPGEADLLAAVNYFRQPFEESPIEPNGPSLEGKNVVILCNVSPGAAAEFPSLEREVPRMLAEILRKKVKKITIVEPDKFNWWVKTQPRDTEPDLGVDVAIVLEIEQFQSQSPGDLNMVHGDSKVHIQVFEMNYPKNSRGRLIREYAHEIYNEYAESTFPKRGPLPIDTGTSRNAFKHTFLNIVVKEISWHFVAHREQDSLHASQFEK